MTTKQYQEQIASYLRRKIGGLISQHLRDEPNMNDKHDYERNVVQVEKHMKIESNLYSPRCDIAVGPFAFTCQYQEKYNTLLHNPEIKSFLGTLLQGSENTGSREVEDFIPNCGEQNRNPRAFMVIEVEGSSCRNGKLILGSMVNASIMGQVGIIVPYLENTTQRVQAYIKEMGDRQKTSRIFKNLIVIKKEKLDRIISNPH